VIGKYFTICQLYPEHLRSYGPSHFLRHDSVSLVELSDPRNKDKHHYDDLKKAAESQRPSTTIKLSKDDEWWLRELGFVDLTPLVGLFQEIRKEIEQKNKSRMDILNAFV
jgi:hypothetical protein